MVEKFMYVTKFLTIYIDLSTTILFIFYYEITTWSLYD